MAVSCQAEGISCTRGICVVLESQIVCLEVLAVGARGLTRIFHVRFLWMDAYVFLLKSQLTKPWKANLIRLKLMKLVADFQDLLRRSQHGLKQVARSIWHDRNSCIGLSPSRYDMLVVAGLHHTNPQFSNSTLNHTPRPHGVWGEKKNPRWLAIRLDVGFPQVQARVSDTKWVNCTGHHVALTWAKAPPSNPDWPMEQTFTFSFSIPINLNHVCTDPSRICVAFGQSGWVASSGTSPDPKDQVSFCVGAWSQLTV